MKEFKIIIVLVFAFGLNSWAQQDPMLSQYMFNGMMLNPGYAGSHEYWSSTLTYRNQWTGANFKGAPQTYVASADGPIAGRNLGLGVVLMHDRLGVSQSSIATLNFAYHIRTSAKTTLSLGLSAGAANYAAQFEDLNLSDPNDVVYAANKSVWLPRFGFGAYFYMEKFYAGVSIPTLLAYENGKKFNDDLSKASFLRRHYLLTAGGIIGLSSQVKMKPSFLIKYVHNAPLQADVNLSFVFRDAFWIGASYRTLDAVAIIVEYQTPYYFRIGYSYDVTTSKLRHFSKGSHEIMLGFDFGKDKVKIKTPRYF